MSFVLQDVCERIERKTPFLFPILLIHESKKTGYETNYLDGFGFGFGPKRSRFCTTNIVAFASRLKRLLFVPRSTIVERGTNKIGSKSDGVEEAKMDLKISGLSEINDQIMLEVYSPKLKIADGFIEGFKRRDKAAL